MNLTHLNGSRVKKTYFNDLYKEPAPLSFQSFEKRYQAMHQITESFSFTAGGQKFQALENILD